MKQVVLAIVLIAVPVAGFTAVEIWLVPASPHVSTDAPSAPLGDLSAYETIVADTRKLADAGDFAAAEHRITDFETKWDDAEATMRPLAQSAWGNVDDAADAAFAALRAGTPDPANVTKALAALSATLANPSAAGGPAGSIGHVAGIAVTDANGHALPCETMLSALRKVLADTAIATADRSQATGLQAKALERCNADDDARADAFAAQALALAKR